MFSQTNNLTRCSKAHYGLGTGSHLASLAERWDRISLRTFHSLYMFFLFIFPLPYVSLSFGVGVSAQLLFSFCYHCMYFVFFLVPTFILPLLCLFCYMFSSSSAPYFHTSYWTRYEVFLVWFALKCACSHPVGYRPHRWSRGEISQRLRPISWLRVPPRRTFYSEKNGCSKRPRSVRTHNFIEFTREETAELFPR